MGVACDKKVHNFLMDSCNMAKRCRNTGTAGRVLFEFQKLTKTLNSFSFTLVPLHLLSLSWL